MKHLLQVGHLCGLSPVCMRRCVFSDDEVLKPFEQMSQMCGFSPVCVRRCRVSKLGRSNSLPQCSQGNMVRLRIFFICCCCCCWLDWLLVTFVVREDAAAAAATALAINEPDRSMGSGCCCCSSLIWRSLLNIMDEVELVGDEVMLSIEIASCVFLTCLCFCCCFTLVVFLKSCCFS